MDRNSPNPIASDAKSEVSFSAPLDQLPILAERASRFARLGDLTSARNLISALRARNKDFYPILSGWILLAEAIVDRTEFLSAGAIDKFRRAYAIAHATSDLKLCANSAAWLGAAEYGIRNIEAAIKYSGEALSIEECEHGARARAFVVLGDCFNFAGEESRSRQSYYFARKHAIADSDISMQSVIIYNSAAFRVCRISLEDAFSFALGESPADVELSLSSSENLDKGLSNTSLWPLAFLLKAQLRVVQRDWAAAIDIFENILPKAVLKGEHGWQCRLKADFAYCQANAMNLNAALKIMAQLEDEISESFAIDDLAATYARLALAAKIIGDMGRYEINMKIATQYFGKFREAQARILQVLNVAFPEVK